MKCNGVKVRRNHESAKEAWLTVDTWPNRLWSWLRRTAINLRNLMWDKIGAWRAMDEAKLRHRNDIVQRYEYCINSSQEVRDILKITWGIVILKTVYLIISWTWNVVTSWGDLYDLFWFALPFKIQFYYVNSISINISSVYITWKNSY